jgi:hypothetical protein
MRAIPTDVDEPDAVHAYLVGGIELLPKRSASRDHIYLMAQPNIPNCRILGINLDITQNPSFRRNKSAMLRYRRYHNLWEPCWEFRKFMSGERSMVGGKPACVFFLRVFSFHCSHIET